MSMRRSAVVAVLAWLAVVAVGSSVVWVVISRAGDGIAPTADPGVVVTSAGAGPDSPTAPAASARPSRRPTSSGTPGPVAQRRTWQGAGGLVIAQCRGPAISLVSSSADPGFRVEVGDHGPEQLEVHFEGQGEEGRETELIARCVDGTPEFDVASTDD
ncbi:MULTISPECIES: hypothetical protein [unclassified Nocardioides]|uniref:hypothetical protein n=1 Tax=unclassified Nocardioides TaxID=2615069 RepID=UPI0000EB63A7|nr:MULTISPECIES: hypothetical protein [unclassified Nocardioides]ABL83325.1 hypothetical protein Noca_3825 [Nocardioides sp. JS614]